MFIASTEILIKKARIKSDNEDFGTAGEDDYGISDEPFIESLNDAQVELQSAIVTEDAAAFVAYKEVDIIANHESYDVPENAFVENLVYGVEFSIDGTEARYIPLEIVEYRDCVYQGSPQECTIEGGKIYINPVPTSAKGSLRIRFEKILDALDKRRGTIRSIGGTGLAPTSIVLEEEDADTVKLGQGVEYVCVNSAFGQVKMRNIPIAAWDESNLLLTIADDFEADDDDIEIEAGDFITIGANTTTHSKLKYICQPYLTTYAQWDAYGLKSSTDSIQSNAKLDRLLKRIVEVYQRLPGGKQQIIERRL